MDHSQAISGASNFAPTDSDFMHDLADLGFPNASYLRYNVGQVDPYGLSSYAPESASESATVFPLAFSTQDRDVLGTGGFGGKNASSYVFPPPTQNQMAPLSDTQEQTSTPVEFLQVANRGRYDSLPHLSTIEGVAIESQTSTDRPTYRLPASSHDNSTNKNYRKRKSGTISKPHENWPSTRIQKARARKTYHSNATSASVHTPDTVSSRARFVLEICDTDNGFSGFYDYCKKRGLSLGYDEIVKFIANQTRRSRNNPPLHHRQLSVLKPDRTRSQPTPHTSRRRIEQYQTDRQIALRFCVFRPLKRPRQTKTDGVYTCTLALHCRCTFKTRTNWRRHEALHYPQEIWLCRHPDCTTKNNGPKAFLQKQHAKQDYKAHYGEEHSGQILGKNRVDVPNSQYPRRCVFQGCDKTFEAFEERLWHIAGHLEEHHVLDRRVIFEYNEGALQYDEGALQYDEEAARKNEGALQYDEEAARNNEAALQDDEEVAHNEENSGDDEVSSQNTDETESVLGTRSTDDGSSTDNDQEDQDPSAGAGGHSSTGTNGGLLDFGAGSSRSAANSSQNNISNQSVPQFQWPLREICARLITNFSGWALRESDVNGRINTEEPVTILFDTGIAFTSILPTLTYASTVDGATERSVMIRQRPRLLQRNRTYVKRPQRVSIASSTLIAYLANDEDPWTPFRPRKDPKKIYNFLHEWDQKWAKHSSQGGLRADDQYLYEDSNVPVSVATRAAGLAEVPGLSPSESTDAEAGESRVELPDLCHSEASDTDSTTASLLLDPANQPDTNMGLCKIDGEESESQGGHHHHRLYRTLFVAQVLPAIASNDLVAANLSFVGGAAYSGWTLRPPSSSPTATACYTRPPLSVQRVFAEYQDSLQEPVSGLKSTRGPRSARLLELWLGET